MRYGKSLGNHELDPTARRKPNMSLKKAAPGAPFGWTSDGSPYVGTQYAVRSKPGAGLQLQFASLSTRNGAPQFYWKPLVGVSAKVALSALETHGSVRQPAQAGTLVLAGPLSLRPDNEYYHYSHWRDCAANASNKSSFGYEQSWST